MKLIVLSTSSGEPEKEIAILTQLFEHGLDTFHLRKPRYSTRELKAYIERIPARFHHRIVIHSHHLLALKFNLKGIHITRTHYKHKYKLWFNLKLLKLKKPDITLSTSYRKLASLYEEKNVFDYVFLAPIFDSISGKFQAGYSEHSLRAAIQKTPFSIIARGGIDSTKIEKVADVGFAGLTINSSLWKAVDPLEEFTRVLEEFRRLKLSAA
jgi:thiamine-phosphate pyrophosphorylase